MQTSPLISLGVSLIAGIATAIISVTLALRRFRAERWWERKAETYAALFEALFGIQHYLDKQLSHLEEGATYAPEYLAEVNRTAHNGYAQVRRTAVMAPFLLSSASAKRLQELVSEFDDPHYNEDPHEQVTASLNAVARTLKELPDLAKRDLSLR